MSDNRYTTEQLKKEIRLLTKKGKIDIIRQKLEMFREWQSKDGKDLSLTIFNQDFYEGTTELLKEIENDNSIAYQHDLNWYFNADIINNQRLAFSIKDYLENKRKDVFETLYFFNLLYRQVDEMKDSLEMPIDYVNTLKKLPLNEIQKHILFGMLLYWHGGYPINNLNPKYDTILKFIEREFLAMFPNEITPEKEFCSKNLENQKRLNELAAHIGAVMPGVQISVSDERNSEFRRLYPESHYIDKVSFDFEDLPHYVIQRGIIWRFENQMMHKDAEYHEWQNKIVDFLNSIPNQYRIKAIQKGIEYGKKVYEYHLLNECTDPKICSLNQSWERRIALAENMLQDAQEQIQSTKEIEKEIIPEKTKILQLQGRFWLCTLFLINYRLEILK